jgi:hypothetical protein
MYYHFFVFILKNEYLSVGVCGVAWQPQGYEGTMKLFFDVIKL